MVEYDSKKRFAIKQTNTLGHTAETTYDNKYGNVLTQKNANGLTSSNAYDGFGRAKESTNSTNQKITVTRAWDNSITNGVFVVQTSQPGTPTSKEYFDVLGRTLRSETQGFDGSTIFTTKSYNNRGQMLIESEPNGIGSPTQYIYETDFNRLKTVTSPGGTTVIPLAWICPLRKKIKSERLVGILALLIPT
ncbi:MAG: hypothetical protein EPN85_01985 [Bacteroidetes bacterium]|nr:MAG: hypothetical protein EPN85_01985 [Bacteroidota bacterium]